MADISLIEDPRLQPYSTHDSGFTALVTGPTGSGKTLALRGLIEYLGVGEVVVLATDPRLAPLDGLNVKVLPAWLEPGADGSALKSAAIAAWDRLQGFFADLVLASRNPKVKIPRAVVLDSLTNLGDILAAKLAPPGGQLSQPQWGELARQALGVVGLLRGLQRRGLVRIINCTTGIDKDPYDRPIPVLFVGTGGKLAPRHTPRHVDFQFHIEAFYQPGHEWAGADGMVRRWHTCEHDGITAKGHPSLPTPFMKADWQEVMKRVFSPKDGGQAAS